MRGLSMAPVEPGSSTARRIESLHSALMEEKIVPDIFSIQEGTRGDLIAEKFGLHYSYHGSKSALWVLTKYPIVDQGELSGEEKIHSASGPT